MNTLRRPIERTRQLPRRVLPELLDDLPADDPRARRSRRDLQRVNRLMNSRSLLACALDKAVPSAPRRIVELGAGDGTMMLWLARSRAWQWPQTAVTLLDQQPVIATDTLTAIVELGWSLEVAGVDVFDWLAGAVDDRDTLVFANLFVHHFQSDRLKRLLGSIARHCSAFVCCEPRRSPLAIAGSRALGLIGCNAVTRHDALRSVHAGFRDRELSSTWQATCGGHWQLDEYAAGLFSHVFMAARTR